MPIQLPTGLDTAALKAAETAFSDRRARRDLAALEVTMGPSLTTAHERLAFLLRYLRESRGGAERGDRLQLARTLATSISERRQILRTRGRGASWEEASA